MSSFRADDFLEKMDTKDPDFRYMAVEDLLKECQKPDFKMDAKVEPKIVAKIVYMIGNDSSGDVKSVAMKCISPLANKVSDEQFKAIVDGLSQIIFVLKSSSTPETQDISTMALKAILVECAESKGDYFVADLAPKLTENITKPKTPETVWFCLDLQNDILGRWGRQMSAQGQTSKLLTAVLPHLTSDNNRARNKAIGCLGYICFSLPEAQLNDLISKLLSQAKSAKKKEHLRAYMMAIAAVCRSADRGRVAQHLNNILPVVLGNIDNQQEDFQDDEELKDNSLQGLEALLNRCPKEVDASFAKVQATCLKFISWDPMLVQVDEEDGDTVVADDADAFVEDGDDGLLLGDSDEVVDDEDSSWKVRKAAARCVFSIIRTRPDKLTHIFEEFLPVLIKRFTEREESVKLDVMAVVGEILREAEHIIRAEKDSKTSHTILAKLAVVAPQIYKSAVKELTSKSPKSKVSGFQLLKELASVAPGAFTDSNFVEGVTLALVPSSSSPLKIQALEFLRAVVNPQTAPSFLDKLGELTKSIYVAVNDVYYKVVAEALRVVSQLIKTISSVSGQDAHASDLFSAILPKLKLTDVDLEVKDTAIEAAGLLVSLLGGKLKPAQVEECFAIFQTRLANELTRINSIKTISQTARAKVPLGNVLGDTVKALAGFLNKTNRLLIQVSLIALFDIISGPDGQLKPATSHYEQLLKDLSILLEGQDLQLAHLGLQVVKAVLHANGGLSGSAVNLILPKTNVLLVQPTFQGPALHSLVSVFEELGKAGNPEKLVDGLSKLAVGDLPKSSIHAVAQCIAAAVSANAQGREAVLATFIKNIADGKDENQKLLALYVTGEIGSKTDITGAANLAKNVLAAFDASSVELKSAASVSFGCVCSQNISKFLEELKASPQRKFLLLGSLREIIVRLSASPEGKTVINPHFDHLLGTLLEQTAHEDEDTRNIVSECLGKLTSINPEAVVVALSKRTSDSNSHTKSCVTTAIKFSITDKPQPVDAILASNVNVFLNLLNDKEVKVRHAVVGSLLQSAHAKPSIIRDALTEFLPVIYDQTRIRPELIKEIECGPIKHKIDEGLETRQATFELMFTLLETCLSRLELQAFITKLVSGLADEYDIQLLNHQIIIRLAKNAKSALVAGLEQLLAPLTLCVNSVPKDANNAEQVEKTTTLIRSAMRAIAAVNHIPDVADTCPQFQEFMKSKILGVEKLAKVYAEVTK